MMHRLTNRKEEFFERKEIYLSETIAIKRRKFLR